MKALLPRENSISLNVYKTYGTKNNILLGVLSFFINMPNSFVPMVLLFSTTNIPTFLYLCLHEIEGELELGVVKRLSSLL